MNPCLLSLRLYLAFVIVLRSVFLALYDCHHCASQAPFLLLRASV